LVVVAGFAAAAVAAAVVVVVAVGPDAPAVAAASVEPLKSVPSKPLACRREPSADNRAQQRQREQFAEKN